MNAAADFASSAATDLCPICLHKLQHSLGFDVKKRFAALDSALAEIHEFLAKGNTDNPSGRMSLITQDRIWLRDVLAALDPESHQIKMVPPGKLNPSSPNTPPILKPIPRRGGGAIAE